MSRLLSCCLVLFTVILCIEATMGESTNSPACQLLKLKQQQLNDVINGMGENGLILKSLKSLVPDSVYSKKEIDDEMALMTSTIQELSIVKNKVGLHVEGLKMLCSSASATTMANPKPVDVSPIIKQPKVVPPIPVEPKPVDETSPKQVAPSSVPPKSIPLTTLSTPISQPIITPITVKDDAFIIGEGLKSCQEYKKELLETAKSGLYWIKPNPNTEKFIVYCDQTISGGGWTLISTRTSSKDLKYANIVKPDFSGSSLSDEKWAAIRAVSTDLMWKDSTNNFAIATIAALSSSGCKPLSKKLTDDLLFHREDSGCSKSGMDYCLLGVTSKRSPEIHRLCSNNPYKIYQFNDDAKGAKYLKESNVLVR